ncbi:hypothetical protein HYW74_03210 [Candidatus Pacearchaeota archaeon]|nr:hypothetical protein [Candidatus Pacearchaeota archaeon]
MKNDLIKLVEYRVVDFLRHNPTHGIKVSGLHRKLRVSYNMLNSALDNLLRDEIIIKDREYYRPENLSKYRVIH